jgi:signal transduction histidine kinase
MPLADLKLIQDPRRLEKLRSLSLLDTEAEDSFDRLTQLASRLIKAPIALVTLMDAHRQFYKSQVGLAEPLASQREIPLAKSYCQHLFASDEPLLISDAREHPLVHDNPAVQEMPAISYAGFPLKTADGFLLGSFCVIDTKPREWTEMELEILGHLADSAIKEIELRAELAERRRIEQVLQENIEHLILLRRIDKELSEDLNLEKVSKAAIDTVLRLSGADSGFIALIEENGLQVVEALGHYTTKHHFELSHGVIGRAMATRRSQYVLDVQNDPDYVPDLPNTKSQIALPLVYRERVLGVLNLETSKRDTFTPESFEFLDLISARIATAVENSRLFFVIEKQLRELHGLYARVEDLEQLKTDMIRIAAHDLRNPLTGIRGFAEYLLEDATEDEQREVLQSIVDAALQMQQIISDILSVQRIEALQSGELHAGIDLGGVAMSVFLQHKPQALRKELQFTYNSPEQAIRVKGDEAQIREVIGNLLTNAIKYTPEKGSVVLELRTEEQLAVLEVIDTGYGIPEEQQAKLFQPFYRAKSSAAKVEGLGLGLHLVKSIVERHGGKMRFSSVLNHGSVFGFELPLE